MARKHLGVYANVLSRVRQALSSDVDLREPFQNETDFARFRRTVEDGRRLLPSRYHSIYVDVLSSAIVQAERTARRGGVASRIRVINQLESVFSTLAQPIVQLASNQQSDQLMAFQALVSNLYRRFMDDPKVRGGARKTLRWPEIDPLAFFAIGKTDAFTLSASPELQVSLIAKPASHANFVPLWLIDGHEVGGHVIHEAVVGFEAEIGAAMQGAIKKAFRMRTISPSTTTVKMRSSGSFLARWRNVQLEGFMLQVFSKWVPELCADASGVLNMGPMYANGGMFVLAAHDPRPANRALFAPGIGADEHPADVLRALFAIEMVERLPIDQRKEYGQALRNRLTEACGGSLHENVVFMDDSQTVYAEVKLSDIAQILAVLADTLSTTKLKCLGDRSMTELMTWGNKDETTTARIARILPRGFNFTDVLEARHVVAAAVLACEQSSDKPDFVRISQRIHDNAVLLLKSLYEEQCLLCAIPEYGETRRTDAISLANLARLVKNLSSR